jgi:hypothetical protein
LSRARLAAAALAALAAIGAPRARAADLAAADTPASGASCFDRGAASGGGPLPSGSGPADFGAVPETCSAGELLLRLRGVLLVASDMPDYYGLAAVGATFRLRVPIDARTWMSFAADVVTYRYVANASVRSSQTSLGPLTVGLYRTVMGGAGAAPESASAAPAESPSLALYGRALLPFDTARQNSVETGLEVGVSARLPLRPRSGLQGGLALAAPADVISGQLHVYLRPAVLAEGWFAPRRWLALFAGAWARAQATPDPGFTTLAARAAVRFARRDGLALALVGEVPFAGSDRTDLVASILLGWAPR